MEVRVLSEAPETFGIDAASALALNRRFTRFDSLVPSRLQRARHECSPTGATRVSGEAATSSSDNRIDDDDAGREAPFMSLLRSWSARRAEDAEVSVRSRGETPCAKDPSGRVLAS